MLLVQPRRGCPTPLGGVTVAGRPTVSDAAVFGAAPVPMKLSRSCCVIEGAHEAPYLRSVALVSFIRATGHRE